MELLMSKHALEQARERGVSINEIKETIQRGAKFPQNGKTIAVYRHIKIAFKKINEFIFVMSEMLIDIRISDHPKIPNKPYRNFLITVMIKKAENGK